MLLEVLITLFERELHKLKQEIASYQNEQRLWIIDKNIANSGGNLALHLVGNLNHYIGKQLGATGYIRERDLEFTQKDVPQVELLTKIEQTITVVKDTLCKLNEGELQREYPEKVLDKTTTIEYFLVHLLAHLTYHLGQINYHRRLLDIG